MRTIDPNLYAALQEGLICRLIKLTTKNNVVYGWCDSDMPITVDGQLYTPAPGLQALSLVMTSDTEVSAQKVSGGWVDVPEEDIRAGLLDSAVVEGAWASHEHPEYGRYVVFSGKIDNITYTVDGFEAEILSLVKQLERNIGLTYTANCRHKLFGQPGPGKAGACTLSAGTYTFTGAVATVVKNRWKFTVSGLSNPDGYFSSGTLTFSSGENAGASFQVKTHSSDTFELFLPTGRVINVGDTFSVSAGCDKTVGTCKAKFDNLENFGGFPHINSNVNYR